MTAHPFLSETREVLAYPLTLTGEIQTPVPRGGRILHLGQQDGVLTVWAEVDTAWDDLGDRSFRPWLTVTATGEATPENGDHIGSVQMPDGAAWHVWHVSSCQGGLDS